MKTDISSRKDIKLIISKFYELLLVDKRMIPFFEDIVAQNHLEEHLEVISDFWNDILFNTTTYKNNTMQKHLDKNAFVKFEKEHFSIWTSYLFQTIDAYFQGEISERMKNRATSIATVMQLKMNVFKK
ncbi:group III truncated hemoglobin [Polaribacter sp. PL03]|uniref:group III truncated hemoglobin n=1 Tax=Polaribacter sp. PL03 TaxID=3088353 RepID=UPI0029D2A1D0|nr:group III truncated hemoglobin [Polaribacter sp. PL03]MDX6747687.1 group III truncated hemoglobin [Polaribacter sp. PL03]